MTTLSAPAAAPLTPQNKFVVLPRFPSACTSLLNRVSDVIWEKRFNIRTAGRRDVLHADAVHYEPLPYHSVFRIMDRLRLQPDDVLVDLGSGMGRAVCVGASYPVKASIGVEIEPDLHALALENVARARSRRSPIQLVCQSATEYDFRGATALWVFNPFGASTMRTVMGQLERSLLENPRTVRIAYINATCAHVLAALPWIEVEECWEMSAWSRIKTPVHFYRTRRAP